MALYKMATLTLRNVTKVFGSEDTETMAVDNVSLDIGDGELLVLVGPSGSGKSTILRSIAGLEDISSGEITLGDEEISGRKPKDREIAMVFQSYALYPHLSARKNMSFGLKMRGELSKEEIEQRVEDAAEIMDIGDLLDKMPNELSGGQKQRVSLGRAIVRDPKAFLMDEPLSNLDAKLRTLMRTEIQRLQSDLDVTTVYVTHDQTEAMTMGDRIAIMNDAELQQVATPLEAYHQPTNKFVAGFIGNPSMNFIDVEMRRTDGGVSFEHPAFEYNATDKLPENLPQEDQQVVLGIRPEDIEVDPERSENSFSVIVDVVEPLGKEQFVYFDMGSGSYIANVSGRQVFSEGEEIRLGFPEDRVHVFDAQTGEAITNATLIEDEKSLARLLDT